MVAHCASPSQIIMLELMCIDSGTTLDAQKRYADGAREIIRRYFAKQEQDPVNVIVIDGEYASKAYGQRQAKASGQRTAAGA